MELRSIGIDVSKDRLDVYVLPEGTACAVARDGTGLAELVERLSALQPERIAVEATGGFETVVAAVARLALLRSGETVAEREFPLTAAQFEASLDVPKI
jgi:transposase